MTSAAQFAAKAQRLAYTTGRVNRQAVTDGAMAGTAIVSGSMLAAGVKPGGRLRTGGRVNVGFQVRGYENATALLGMRGAAHLVNNPTKPHEISARRAPGSRRRRGGKKALAIGDDRFVRVQHPGTRGKQFWQKSETVMRNRVPEVVARAHRAAWRKEFT